MTNFQNIIGGVNRWDIFASNKVLEHIMFFDNHDSFGMINLILRFFPQHKFTLLAEKGCYLIKEAIIRLLAEFACLLNVG